MPGVLGFQRSKKKNLIWDLGTISVKRKTESEQIKKTYALYLIDGYSPKVEQRVANCSAILSISKLRLEALLGS